MQRGRQGLPKRGLTNSTGSCVTHLCRAGGSRGTGLKLPIVAVAVAVGAAGAPSAAKLPPLHDPVFLNIGFVCQWQDECIAKQQKAHKQVGGLYEEEQAGQSWQVQLCNRRASFRRTGRVDWISYYHCISNAENRGRDTSSRNRR